MVNKWKLIDHENENLTMFFKTKKEAYDMLLIKFNYEIKKVYKMIELSEYVKSVVAKGGNTPYADSLKGGLYG